MAPQRKLRKRRAIEEPEEEEEMEEQGTNDELSRALSLRKLHSAQRHHARSAGVDANEMLKPVGAHGSKISASSSATVAGRALSDAFQGGQAEPTEPEDPLVEQYVQSQLSKQRATSSDEQAGTEQENAPSVGVSENEKKQLYETPRELDSKRHVEEEGPEKHLSGIVEVTLPVEQRMRNVEATERAKARMLDQQAGLASFDHDSIPSYQLSGHSAPSDGFADAQLFDRKHARRMLPKSFSGKPAKKVNRR